jgi:hypothetical protein
MKKRSLFAQYSSRVMLISLPFLGVFIANRTYQYEIIVKGILGSTVIYLLFYYLKSSKSDLTLKNMADDPKVLNHALFVFVAPIISYWASGGIFDMISLLIKSLTEFFK